MKKRIFITETQLEHILSEDATFSAYKKPRKRGRPKKGYDEFNDNYIDLSIGQDMSDKKNMSGNLSVDTRAFGSRKDILYGDGSDISVQNRKKGVTPFTDKYNLNSTVEKLKKEIECYQIALYCIKNGQRDNMVNMLPEGEFRAKNTILKWVETGKSDNYIASRSIQNINRLNFDNDVNFNMYNRLTDNSRYGYDIDKKVGRYNIINLNVDGENVKVIALFSFKDFCFHSALKHNVVPVSKVKEVYSDNDYVINRAGNRGDFPVTFDNGRVNYDVNDIHRHFSLNESTDHYKLQYNLQGKNLTTSDYNTLNTRGNGNNNQDYYSSINQFLDKSVMYARYALKEEGFKPDFIISCPSSSDFNKCYCTNLSNKLGIPFFNDFFQKDMVNMRIKGRNDKTIEECMAEDGFDIKEQLELKHQVKSMAIRELSIKVSEPIIPFIEKYKALFTNIVGIKSNKKTVLTLDDVRKTLSNYAFNCLKPYLGKEEKEFGEYLLENFMNQDGYANRNANIINYKAIRAKMETNKECCYEIVSMLKSMYGIMNEYIDVINNEGYFPTFISLKKTKITEVDKLKRNYLDGLYMIRNKYMSGGDNEGLMTRFRNANFLIFDEDINSGASLRLCVMALKSQIPSSNIGNIVCLTNAYSNTGT